MSISLIIFFTSFVILLLVFLLNAATFNGSHNEFSKPKKQTLTNDKKR